LCITAVRMAALPPESSNCPHCGAPNPASAEVCAYCGGRIPAIRVEAPPISPPLRDDFRLVTPVEPPSRLWPVLLVLGILLIIVGIALLAVAPSVHQSVESFNNICTQNPYCQPQSDPSGAMSAGGVAAVIVGVVLVVVGAYLRSN
jgi:uncharacterized membrane protein